MMSTIAMFLCQGTCISNVRWKQGFQQKPATGEFCGLLPKLLLFFDLHLVLNLMQGDNDVTRDDS